MLLSFSGSHGRFVDWDERADLLCFWFFIQSRIVEIVLSETWSGMSGALFVDVMDFSRAW